MDPSSQHTLDVRWDLLFSGSIAQAIETLRRAPARAGARVQNWVVDDETSPSAGSMSLWTDGHTRNVFWNLWTVSHGCQISGGIYINDFHDSGEPYLNAALVRAHAQLMSWFCDPRVMALSLTDEDVDSVELAPYFAASYKYSLWAKLTELGARSDGLVLDHRSDERIDVHPRCFLEEVDSDHFKRVSRPAIDSIYNAVQTYISQRDCGS